MKIVFFISQLRSGGAERTVSYLANYLIENEQVYFVTYNDDFFYEIDPRVKVVMVSQKNVINPRFKKWNPIHIFQCLVNIARRIYYVNKCIASINPDVVFCIIADIAKPILLLHKIKKFKLISSERSNPQFDNQDMVSLRKIIFEQCDGVIFQTNKAKEYYSKSIQEKSVVIHNAVGNKYAYNVPRIAEREKMIVAIGRLSTEKGYDILLKAFAIFHETHPGYTLAIYGVGNQKEEYEGLCDALKLSDCVKFMGVSTEALKESWAASCYVLASRYEGMPNSLMEAMAAGIPCVSTDCPNGPSEIIQNGENGILVPVEDVEALCDAMSKMVDDIQFAEKCSENARKIVDTHNIPGVCEKYYKYIYQVKENCYGTYS